MIGGEPCLNDDNQQILTAASLKWTVGAWGIQGLPLCLASPQIEYSPHGWQIPATQPGGTGQHWLDQWNGE